MAHGQAGVHGRPDDPEFRAWLADALDAFADRRVERHWQLLAVVNGWPAVPSILGAWEWTVAALRASLA